MAKKNSSSTSKTSTKAPSKGVRNKSSSGAKARGRRVSVKGLGGSEARAKRPIIDTHIHLYQVSRPGGVPWPEKKQKLLYRDVLPADYKALAQANGIVACGIVEASPLDADNLAVLEMTKGDRFFSFLVAQLEIGAPNFEQALSELLRQKRVVGVRCFLWSPKLELGELQLAHLREIEKHGLVLDLVSRRTMNPKDMVSKLASQVPSLRIVLDHLAGARGEAPDPTWELEMRRLADLHPNIYVKFSSFFDMFQTSPTEEKPWKSPMNVDAYRPHFEVLLSAFGSERLIWGSNWPVSDLGGPFEEQIRLAEEFLAPYGVAVRDRVMFRNAKEVYRRLPEMHEALRIRQVLPLRVFLRERFGDRYQ